jgi:WD40 repeat protein
MWDLQSSREVANLEGHAGPVEFCTFDASSQQVLSAGDDYTLKLWDVGAALATGEERAQPGPTGARFCRFAPDRKILIATGDEIAQVDAAAEPGASATALIPMGEGQDVSYCYDPNRGLIAVGRTDKSLHVYSIHLKKRVLELTGHAGWVTACVFSSDGRLLATGSRDDTLKVWDAEKGTEIATLSGHEERITSCAFSPDGTRLVSGSWDETLRIWDVGMGTEISRLSGHEDRITSCAFSPDGARIISGSHDKTLRLWDGKTGRPIVVLHGHDSAVTCCCFSRDGRLAVSGGEDNTIIVWDAVSPRELSRFIGVGFIGSCDIDTDNRTLCCTDSGGNLYVFDLIGLC